MNNEFKKTKHGLDTVYTLESASGGATSAGAVASVSSPMGGIRKRGGLVTSEEQKKEPHKPRNFVAKNAKMGGAGQHKDKKKAEKQGDVKHKKPFAENIEALKSRLDYLKESLEAQIAGQGVAEGGFKNLYAEFSGYGNYMRGRAVNVFMKAGLDIVSKDYSEDEDIQTYIVKGDRWAIEKAGEFLERNPEEFGGYHFVKQSVDEDAGSMENQVVELLKRFDSDMNEIGGYGDPDVNQIIQHLKNGDAESAAEVVWYAYSDQDGGEIRNMEPYVDDLQADFESLIGNTATATEDPYMEQLAAKVAEKLDPGAPTDVWVKDFQKANPNKYHQFKNKTPQKKAQMAVAAHYAANEPSKKK